MKTPSPLSGASKAPGRTRTGRTVKNLALAAALTSGSLGITSTMTVSEAQAFGLGDITGAAKKVGGAVKKGAKKTGSIVKKVGKVTHAPYRAINDAALKAVREGIAKPIVVTLPDEIAKKAGWYNEYWKEDSEGYARGIDKHISVPGIKNLIERGGKKVGKVVTGRNQIGESLPRPDKTKAENALTDYMNRRGGITRKTNGVRTFKPGIAGQGSFLKRGQKQRKVQGIRTKDLKRRFNGRVRPPVGAGDKKFHGVPMETRPVIGHDKSVWGNPVFGKKRKARKVQGIRLKDIRKRKRRSNRRIIRRDKNGLIRNSGLKKRSLTNRGRLGNKMLRKRNRKDDKSNFKLGRRG